MALNPTDRLVESMIWRAAELSEGRAKQRPRLRHCPCVRTLVRDGLELLFKELVPQEQLVHLWHVVRGLDQQLAELHSDGEGAP